MDLREIENKNAIPLIIGLLSYLLWFVIYQNIEEIIVVDSNRQIVSWIGILIYLIFMYVWKKVNGEWFSLMSIFLSFFFLFNFGQSMLWAFGYHAVGELGTRKLFGRYYSELGIYEAQWMFIICFLMFNCGALCFVGNNVVSKQARFETDTVESKTILAVSKIIATFSIPAAYYVAFRNYLLSKSYGYHYLYFGDEGIPTVITIAYALFFPALIGLLIGSNFSNNYRKFVYIIFVCYSLLALACGDRGEWINKLIILLWADHTFHKKISIKKSLLYVVIMLLGLYVVSAVVSLRNTGITFDNVMNSLKSTDNNPIISMIIEFGNSMGINTICLQENVSYPYGNTFLMSFITMPTSRIGRLIYGNEYKHLGDWFPSQYLQINAGTDFTIISETVINFGKYLAPLFFLIEGMILVSLFSISINPEKRLKTVIMIGVLPFVMKIARSTIWYVLNKIFITFIIFYLLYVFIYPIVVENEDENIEVV